MNHTYRKPNRSNIKKYKITNKIYFRCLKPSKQQQLDALCKSFTEILWKIGENEKVIVSLPQEKSYVPHSLNYFQDNITEKVRKKMDFHYFANCVH